MRILIIKLKKMIWQVGTLLKTHGSIALYCIDRVLFVKSCLTKYIVSVVLFYARLHR